MTAGRSRPPTEIAVLIGRDADGDLVWQLPDGRWTWGDDAQEALARGRTFDPSDYVRKFGAPTPD